MESKSKSFFAVFSARTGQRVGATYTRDAVAKNRAANFSLMLGDLHYALRVMDGEPPLRTPASDSRWNHRRWKQVQFQP